MSNPRQLSSIQQLRGIAALLVVLFHGTTALALSSNYGADPTRGIFAGGFSGVDLFFVISGFIIFLLHGNDINRPRKLPAFALKRLVRIYPIYWVVFLVFGGLMLVTHTGGPSYAKSGRELIGAIFLAPQLTSAVIPVAWTLRYEMLFYFTFALAIFSVRLLCVAAVVFSGVLILGPDFQLKSFFTNPVIVEFLFGILAAAMIPRISAFWSRASLIAGGGLFVLLLVASAVSPSLQEASAGEPLYGIAATLIILGWVGLEIHSGEQQRFRNSRLLGTVGDASYVIYLVHQPLINLTIKIALRIGIHLPNLLLVAAIVFVAVGVGVCIHRWLEAPLLKFLNYKLRPLRARFPVAVSESLNHDDLTEPVDAAGRNPLGSL